MIVTQPATQQAIVTIVELISRQPNFEDSMEAGCTVHDFKSVRILSRAPLPNSAITNVLKRYPSFKLHGLSAKNYREHQEF